MMSVIDAGLTSTLEREFAREDKNDKEKVDVFNTLEAMYLLIVLCFAILSFFLAPIITDNWLDVDTNKFQQADTYIFIALVEILFQLLVRFYKGGLLGLEKQVKANVFQIFWGLIRNGFVIIVLIYSSNLATFFYWQLASTAIFVFILKYLLTKEFEGLLKFFSIPKVEYRILKEVWKFAGGVLLISLIASINTQMDRFTISKLLSLEALGYYTLALTAARVTGMVVSPISIAILPRLTALYSKRLIKEARALYDKVNLFVNSIIYTLMLILVFYSYEIIWIWTGDTEIAHNSSFLVMILSVGYSMLSMQVIPFKVALANGYTLLNNIIGIVSLLVTVPGYILFTNWYGAVGAAMTFSIVQGIISLIYIMLIDQKFLKLTNKLSYYVKNYFLNFIILFLMIYLSTFIDISNFNRIFSLIWIGIIFSISVPLSVLIIDKNLFLSEVRKICVIISNYKG